MSPTSSCCCVKWQSRTPRGGIRFGNRLLWDVKAANALYRRAQIGTLGQSVENAVLQLTGLSMRCGCDVDDTTSARCKLRE